MAKKSKIWYSYQGGTSLDSDIGVYNKEDFEWVNLLESNYQQIKSEVKDYVTNNENQIKPYFNKDLVGKANSWRASAFLVWGWSITKNIKQCPYTFSVIKQIPDVVSASISIMEPGADIKPHRGDTNGIVRVHLALEVPYGLPNCGFRVIETDLSWEEGKVIIFNDAAWHKAWNKTDKRRYVLIIDVMRTEFVSKKYTVCSTVLSVLLMQLYIQKISFLRYLPKIGKAIIFYCHILAIKVVLQTRNMLNV